MTSKEFCKVIISFSLYLSETNIQQVTSATLEGYFKSFQYLAIKKELIKDE